MAGPVISHNELFDFENYKRSIKDVQALTKEFGQSVDQTLRNIASAQSELNGSFRDIASVMKAFNLNTNGAKDTLVKYNEELENTKAENERLKQSEAGLRQILDATKLSVTELKSEYARLKKEYENLSPGQANYANQVQKIDAQLKAILPGIKNFETSLRNTKKYVDVSNDSYNQMQQRLLLLKTELKNTANAFDPVTGKLNKSNTEAIRLSDEIAHLDKALKTADATMGVWNRNVGNYASGFSPLKNAVNQITREAPSAAVSMQTFFLAISNNLPALSDAITGLKSANTELVAAGEKPKSIFKALTGALFSFQTLISVGITLLTLYGGKIVDWIGHLFAGKGALNELKETQEGLNTAIESTDYKNAITQLEEMKNNVQLAKAGFIDKKDVVDKYNETLGKTIGQVESLDQVEKNIASKGEAYLQFTLKKAVAQGILQKAVKASIDAEVEQQERSTTIKNLRKSPNSKDGLDEFFEEGLKNEAAAAKQAADKRVKFYKDLAAKVNSEAAAISKANNFDFFGDADKDKKTKDKDDKDAAKQAEERLKKFKDSIAKQQELLKSAAELQIKEGELRVAQGLMSEEAFQREKYAIIKHYTELSIELEKKLGKNADQKKTDEFNKTQKEAEIDLTKFLRDQHDQRQKDALAAMKKTFDEEDADRKRKREKEDELTKQLCDARAAMLQRRLDTLRKEFDLEEAHRGKNFQREVDIYKISLMRKKRPVRIIPKRKRSLT
jgi:hypothetical protein